MLFRSPMRASTTRSSSRTRGEAALGRGIGTLIGNGWLRESPKNLFPEEWHALTKSALKRCVFLPAPRHLLDLAPPPPKPLPSTAPRREPEIAVRRRNPAKDVQLFQAFPGPAPRPKAARAPEAASARAWWEDPIALGSLLILVPPIGLAALWSSRRYSSDARWALTLMTALTMCLTSAIALVALVMA